MKYPQSVIAALLLIVSATTLAVSPASAATTTRPASSSIQDRREKVEERISDLREKASTTREKSCDALTERIDKRLSNFETLYQKHIKEYRLHPTKLKSISAKLEAKGLDVSKLNSDIAILEVKIEKFASDREAVREALLLTKDYSCGDQSGEFRSSIEALREAQRVLAESAKDVRSFIMTSIKADIQELREEYNKNNTN